MMCPIANLTMMPHDDACLAHNAHILAHPRTRTSPSLLLSHNLHKTCSKTQSLNTPLSHRLDLKTRDSTPYSQPCALTARITSAPSTMPLPPPSLSRCRCPLRPAAAALSVQPPPPSPSSRRCPLRPATAFYHLHPHVPPAPCPVVGHRPIACCHRRPYVLPPPASPLAAASTCCCPVPLPFTAHAHRRCTFNYNSYRISSPELQDLFLVELITLLFEALFSFLIPNSQHTLRR